MFPKLKKILQFIWPIAAFCVGLFVLLNTVHAQSYLPSEWSQYLEGLPTFGGPPGVAGEEIAASLIERGIDIVKFVMGAAALLLGIIYATNLVFARGKEEAITKQKQNFLYIFIGFVLLMVADQVSQIFNPAKSISEKIIDFEAAHDQVRDVTNYLKWLFGTIIALLMTISGFRIITAGGEEEVITKEKRHLTWSGIGMLVILLASNIVNAIYVVNEPETGAVGQAAEATVGITEIGGVIRLILVFLGPMAVLFTIYAGFMYLTAFENEDRANKAKRMIVTGVTAIAIVYAAFALVNTILRARLVPPCGDGIVAEEVEECDDGNTLSGDGCSSDCETEQDYTCTGSPSICTR